MTEVSQKSDQSLLSELNAQFINNFLTQDTSSHNKIIHKDFSCIESSGHIVDRETYMKNWATDYANGGYVAFFYRRSHQDIWEYGSCEIKSKLY